MLKLTGEHRNIIIFDAKDNITKLTGEHRKIIRFRCTVVNDALILRWLSYTTRLRYSTLVVLYYAGCLILRWLPYTTLVALYYSGCLGLS